MKKGIELSRISLSFDLSIDVIKIMNVNQSKFTSFVKLFWEPQKDASKNIPKSVRYHPVIYYFCISLASKSLSAYDGLRDVNTLALPGRRTLRDYQNAIQSKICFNLNVMNEFKNAINSFSGIQKFICLCFHET